MRIKTVIIVFLLWKALSYPLSAKETVFDVIHELDNISIVMYGDFDSLAINKYNKYESKGLVEIYEKGKLKFSINARFSVRGKYRRRLCDFPPLLIDFDKDDLEKYGLRKTDKYKLVTHCGNTVAPEKYVFREHLAYKLYNTVTDQSFRTKLLKIKYRSEVHEVENYGILIESNKELAKRLGGDNCTCVGLQDDDFNQSSAWRTSLFQFLVGNNDMSFYTEHNVQFIESKNKKDRISVPYDFDYSFFVNTPYGNREGHLTAFEGVFPKTKQQESFREVVSEYNALEPELISVIMNDENISPGDKKRCIRIVRAFYKEVNKKSFWSKLDRI